MVPCSRSLKTIFRGTRSPSLKQVLVLAAVILVLYNEFLCFTISRLFWASIPANIKVDSTELRVLLVADPQLVGFQGEHPVFGVITRWDCDRFLRSGFQEAFNYVRPNVVLFLGDLLDEGSVASDDDFVSYISRFESVFHVPSDIQRIFIPGDNDVGGEGIELKQKWKVDRFFNNFYRTNQSDVDVVHVEFVDFFRLSYDLGESFASSMKSTLLHMAQKSTAPLRVICNHMGIFVRDPGEYAQLISIVRPSLFITAHTHEALIYNCGECGKILESENFLSEQKLDIQWRGNITRVFDSRVFEFKLDGKQGLLELVVPTCSYRMGVTEIGYGVAIIGSDESLRYSVLWLPQRYPLLYSYITFLVCAVFLLLLRKLLMIVCFNYNGQRTYTSVSRGF